MRFERLDLNLLVALDALLQERSVSMAADRLHLSQSATSGALARLRDYFKDELLVLRGRQMVLTPRAEKLVEPIRDVLDRIRDAVAVADPFDPATSTRTLSIMATDYVVDVLLTQAIVAFAQEAPHMRFDIVPLAETPVEELRRGRADLFIAIDRAISTELPYAPLYSEDFVLVGWRDNPSLAAPMTQALYEELGHITVRFGKQTASHEETVVRALSIPRRVEVLAPDFTSVGPLLVGTNRVATLHRRLANRMAAALPLTLVELPFTIPAVCESAQWDARNANDPAIAWLITRLRAIAAES